jgi:hypothetical protein
MNEISLSLDSVLLLLLRCAESLALTGIPLDEWVSLPPTAGISPRPKMHCPLGRITTPETPEHRDKPGARFHRFAANTTTGMCAAAPVYLI